MYATGQQFTRNLEAECTKSAHQYQRPHKNNQSDIIEHAFHPGQNVAIQHHRTREWSIKGKIIKLVVSMR